MRGLLSGGKSLAISTNALPPGDTDIEEDVGFFELSPGDMNAEKEVCFVGVLLGDADAEEEVCFLRLLEGILKEKRRFVSFSWTASSCSPWADRAAVSVR